MFFYQPVRYIISGAAVVPPLRRLLRQNVELSSPNTVKQLINNSLARVYESERLTFIHVDRMDHL